MAWRRHNRSLTHEVFYEGTTIGGSRLERAMRYIQEKFNKVPKGYLKNRFVAVQYHGGFSPQIFPHVAGAYSHHFPWLQIRNEAGVDTIGEVPTGAPYNEARLKGTSVPGIDLFKPLPGTPGPSTARDGTQWAWSRTYSFKRPVVVDALSVLMQMNTTADVAAFRGTGDDGYPPYTYGSAPPSGFSTGDFTSDVCVILDVFNPTTPEDPEMSDVEYTRRRWVIGREIFTLHQVSQTNAVPQWADLYPTFDSGDVSDVLPIDGRLVDDRDLNIPIPAGSKVRLSIVIPQYNGTVGGGSWDQQPWYIQAWSTTLTVLEEVRSL